MSAELKLAENKWDVIFDFTEKEDGGANFTIVQPADWKMNFVPIEGMDEEPEVVFPYPVRYGGTIPDDAVFGEEEANMAAFNIKTGQ